MPSVPATSGWTIIAVSVQGAAHERSGLPNQDAMGWLPESGAGSHMSVAVADGHGSLKSFRSQDGARLGVDVATTLMQEFLRSCDAANPSLTKRTAEDRLPQEVVRQWIGRVGEHLKNQPFSPEELAALELRDGTKARQAVESNPLIAYGATLLMVGVTDWFIVYLQLGDGDILVVSQSGEVFPPIPRDERLFANETTSLSAPDAWRDFRCVFQVISGNSPALITLSTDGYSNCFVSQQEFLRVGTDLLEVARSRGLELVRQTLEAQLPEASRNYCGDDITVAVLCSLGALHRHNVQNRDQETRAGDYGTT